MSRISRIIPWLSGIGGGGGGGGSGGSGGGGGGGGAAGSGGGNTQAHCTHCRHHNGMVLFKTHLCALTQWSAHGFTHNHVYYRTAEHWMMAHKADIFDPSGTARQNVVRAATAADAKNVATNAANGGHRSLWDRWNATKEDVVYEGNLHKFKAHPAEKQKLLGTYPNKLVEATARDPIWGAGLDAHDIIGRNLSYGNLSGQNLLGKALERVRLQLYVEG